MRIVKPKILHCVTHFSLGGAEEVALSIIEQLHEDFDFQVFAVYDTSLNPVGERMKASLETCGVPWQCGSTLSIKRGGILISSLRLQHILRQFKPDVIHLHTEIPELCRSINRSIYRSGRATPDLRTVHNAKYWHCWSVLGRYCGKVLKDSSVVTVSDGAGREFTRYIKDNSLPQPRFLRRIYNGVDCPAVISNSRQEAKGARGIFAGRFEDQKGADLLPEILKNFQQSTGMKFDLDIFGTGTHASMLKDLGNFCGGTVRVYKPAPDLREILPRYDFLVMPSRYEGLGLVAVEAILNGVIVIATDCDGLNEALPDAYPFRAKAGSADSFAETLSDALERRGEWTEILRETKSFCSRRFSVKTMSEEYAKVYMEMIESQKDE